MRDERFSGRTFDAGGQLDGPAVRRELERHGALHVKRTGVATLADVVEVLPSLGFGPAHRFSLGGRTSAATQEKWAAPGLRRLDAYPADLYLLANNEVQYRRSSPRWVLFACLAAPVDGGRVFLHSARAVEGLLAERAPGLLARMLEAGLSIETGFLDARHPVKAQNTFQSWQERFGTDDADEALRRAQAASDDHDACWWGAEGTLMTRITLTAKWPNERGESFLRFPRVALDPPAAKNGFRRFPLGDGTALTDAEEELVREALLDTREGVTLERGDLVLFDNLRFGHSRESFSGEREVVVGMAGEVWDPKAGQAQERAVRDAPPSASGEERRAQAFATDRPATDALTTALATDQRVADPFPSALQPLATDGPTAYVLPSALVRRDLRFSARTFDAGGSLTRETLSVIRRELETHGALHVQNTGVAVGGPGELPQHVLDALGFGGADTFPWGGMSSGRTTRRALGRELRATDEYPPHLWLLPHNEVLYQRTMPARLLFFSATEVSAAQGGRTFVHSSALLERVLRDHGGDALLEGLRRHGLLIEMGFIDERHPERRLNFFRSWQDRFDTTDRDEAARRCRASTHQFDECWWKDEGGGCFTLMTRVRVPAFSRGHLLFPRVALDEPSLRNGHRRYPRGDGTPFTKGEVDLLLHAFLETREGVAWRAGDLLLCDNVRYGHSREAFEGPRALAVAMAGVVDVGPPP